jgi:purine-binding chemotaxis protein CheW
MLNQTQEKDLRAAPTDMADADAKDENQFVTFMLGDECFGVPMAPVQEIIRVPSVVRVPLAPPNLEGLANLRGCVLPIVNLRRVFGLAEREKDDATRAVVINTGTPLGFVVDRVASVVSVEQRQIESVESIASTVRSDLLTGVVRRGESEPMIMVLDFDRLIANEFDHAGRSRLLASEQAGLAHHSEAALTQAQERTADELQMVSFTVDAQEYGIAIHSVQEIVQTPERITEVPNTEPHVLGVMSLRNRLLPLVSLRRLFALEDKPLSEAQRIVVVSAVVDGRPTSVGVVMDAVNEVLRVPRESAEAVPTVLAQSGNMAEIESICRLDGGKRLVSVLCPEKLFHCVSQAIAAGVEDESSSAEMQSVEDEDKADDEVQLVVFRLANEEYGVPIESVQEIVRIPNLLTSVPRAPAFVEGVINLRGSVLPVVDQRLRFGLEPIGRNDRQRIMVFVIDGARIGFIVDSVAEVLKVAGHHIEPSPRLSEAQGRLVGRVANLEKSNRLIQLVDPGQLLDPAESRSLEQTALK